MYKRKIDNYLINWKNNSKHKPLVIKGCRQCGKTSSVKAFAYKNYKNVIYMDFHEQKELRVLFDGSLQVDYLTTMISSSVPGSQFIPGQTCIIFDELQDCPGARASLKFWRQDGRYDVICTGSLLGVNGYNSNEDYSVPVGSEDIVDMFPMDFEEWLWANQMPSDVIEMLRTHLKDESPVPEILHGRMRTLLLQYVVVGGMPEAVQTFLDTRDIGQVAKVQNAIIEEYKSDMVKYAKADDKARIRECFESIPAQLSKENKKFQYSIVRKGGRSKEYMSSLQWIEDAGIIHRCYNLSFPELPLEGNAIKEEFKVYMADTGLFVSTLEFGTQGDILRGDMMSYKGAVFENVMADIFGKKNKKLYYYHKSDSIELDFVIRYNGECVPVECKARTGRAKSMRTVLTNKEKYHIKNGLKFGDYNIGRNNNLLTLPMYMAFLID
ncbi:MAG: ATP-binding protein [Paludibacteraceae bacterium]|nr:ATP-binding protein [Paludibacteraceae bacterium]